MAVPPLVLAVSQFALLLAIAGSLVLLGDILVRVRRAPRELVLARLFFGSRSATSGWYPAVCGIVFLIASFTFHVVVRILWPTAVTDDAVDAVYAWVGTAGFAFLVLGLWRIDRQLRARVSPLLGRPAAARAE